MPTLTVVVPSVGRPNVLEKCLMGLENQTRSPDNVLVVCQQGDEGTQRMATIYNCQIKLVDEPGVAHAVNSAIHSVTSELICFTDDDAIPRTDWTQRIEEAFSANDCLGALGGRDILPQTPPVDNSHAPVVGRLVLGKFYGNHHRGTSQALIADYPKGVNMSFRRDAIKDINLPLLVVGDGAQVGYEIILGFATQAKGFSVVYDPNILVDHYPAARPPSDARELISWPKSFARAHNRMIALAMYGSWMHVLCHALWSLLIGDRMNPGTLKFLALSFTQPHVATKAHVATVIGIMQAVYVGYKFRHTKTIRRADS